MQATNAIRFLLFAPCRARFCLPVPQRADAGACWLCRLFSGVQGGCSTRGRRGQRSEEPQVLVLLPWAWGGGGGAGPATQCVDAGPARSGPTQKEPRTQAGCRRHHTLGSSDLGLGPPWSGTGSEPGSALTQPRDSCWRVSALCAGHRGGRGLFLRGQRPLGSMRPQRRLCRRRGPGRRAPCRGSRRRSRLRLRAPPPGASVQHLGQRAEGGGERAGPADCSGHCRLKAGTTECDFALLCRSH